MTTNNLKEMKNSLNQMKKITQATMLGVGLTGLALLANQNNGEVNKKANNNLENLPLEVQENIAQLASTYDITKEELLNTYNTARSLRNNNVEGIGLGNLSIDSNKENTGFYDLNLGEYENIETLAYFLRENKNEAYATATLCEELDTLKMQYYIEKLSKEYEVPEGALISILNQNKDRVNNKKEDCGYLNISSSLIPDLDEYKSMEVAASILKNWMDHYGYTEDNLDYINMMNYYTGTDIYSNEKFLPSTDQKMR